MSSSSVSIQIVSLLAEANLTVRVRMDQCRTRFACLMWTVLLRATLSRFTQKSMQLCCSLVSVQSLGLAPQTNLRIYFQVSVLRMTLQILLTTIQQAEKSQVNIFILVLSLYWKRLHLLPLILKEGFFQMVGFFSL